jgi:hypothetical protein
MKPYLSKSLFLRGLQCHKSLWLIKNSPELATPPDTSLLTVFEMGKEVGKLARGLFPGGEAVGFEDDRKKMVEKTQELIESGVETIYEATFRYDNVLVMIDILHRGRKGLEIYEVKSSTGVKDINLSDLSAQYYVLFGGGLPVTKASLVHINNEYVRKGNINVHELFTIVELTDEVKAYQSDVKDELLRMRTALGPDCPDIDIAPHCENPYECDFVSHCWEHIPENSIFELKGKGINKFSYYKNGIVHFNDLDINELNEKQRMQVDAELNDKKIVNKEGVKEFLDTLYYPLYFLDFETFGLAIPPFDGLRPYEHIPFQYSLHLLESKDAELKHYEFLAEPGVDQREELIKGLISLISDNVCILVYNVGFEKSVLSNLAEHFPPYREKLMKIHENFVDLMAPFRQRYYYTKEMKGRYSLKSVLPALLPELSYDGMAISSGGDASVIYSTLHLIEDKKEVEQIKRDLLEYCKFDTFAMVKLLNVLRKAVNKR